MEAKQIQEQLQVAVSLQAGQQEAKAAEIYKRVLEAEPNQPDALHLMALIESQNGRHEQAIKMLADATKLVPNNPTFWGNFGVILKHAGKIDTAIKAYERSLELNPNQAETNYNLGKLFRDSKKLKEAEKYFKQALQLKPDYGSPWLSLMNLACEANNPAAAIAVGRRALEIIPGHKEILLNLAAIQKRQRFFEEADATLQTILGSDPHHLKAICRLASLRLSQNRIDEAIELLSRAEAIGPESRDFLNAKGVFYNISGDPVAAESILRRAVALFPGDSNARANLALALKKQGKLSEALELMQDDAPGNDSHLETRINKAGVLLSLGQVNSALQLLAEGQRERRFWRESADSFLMGMNYSSDLPLEKITEAHRLWNQKVQKELEPLRQKVGELGQYSPREDGALRVGLFSADLGNHPVGFFTVGLLEASKDSELEFIVYSDRPATDPIAARIRAAAKEWHETTGASDTQLLDKARADKLDVAIDLAGHTAGNRLNVFALRCAPVQITWAGYVGSTGLSQMDYILGDQFHLPEGCEEFYSETILRMPNGYVSYEPGIELPAIKPPPFQASGFVTFGAMCNPAKVNSVLLESWRDILSSVDGSRLLLAYSGWQDPGNIKRIRDSLGLADDSEKVRFTSCNSPIETMRLYNSIDIALDTYPYSGGLTTCEALLMGVPTVTLPKRRFCSRHTLSHLSNIGLTEFIAKDEAEYVDLATKLAQRSDRLVELRKSLRKQTQGSPLCNHSVFANNFKKLLQETVVKHT